VSQTFKCDVCGKPVAPKDGKLHALNVCDTIHGEIKGFAFYDWNDDAALDKDYGHLHKACVAEQLVRYMREFKWGQLLFRGKSVFVTEKKLAARR
jgi:hypothetical protein